MTRIPCGASSSAAERAVVGGGRPGARVAAAGVGGGENAALLAGRILALGDDAIAAALEDYHAELERKVIESS